MSSESTSAHRISPQAKAVHEAAIVVDAINVSVVNEAQIRRLRKGGVTAFHWSVARPAKADWEEALVAINDALTTIDRFSEHLALATCVADIRQAKIDGRIAVILGLQNARPISDELDRVGFLHRLGVRIIELTYNERNYVGDGCVEPGNAGLSKFGGRLVDALNGAGMLIDLSHCGERTTLETVERSRRPVVVTHGNARALCDTPRNKTDDAIRAIIKSGGLIGLCCWSPLNGGVGRPTLDTYIGHMQHVIDLADAGAAAVGTDHSEDVFLDEADWHRRRPFGEGLYPETTDHVGEWYRWETRHVAGMGSIAALPNLTQHLLESGFSTDVVNDILGENFLRVFAEVCG